MSIISAIVKNGISIPLPRAATASSSQDISSGFPRYNPEESDDPYAGLTHKQIIERKKQGKAVRFELERMLAEQADADVPDMQTQEVPGPPDPEAKKQKQKGKQQRQEGLQTQSDEPCKICVEHSVYDPQNPHASTRTKRCPYHKDTIRERLKHVLGIPRFLTPSIVLWSISEKKSQSYLPAFFTILQYLKRYNDEQLALADEISTSRNPRQPRQCRERPTAYTDSNELYNSIAEFQGFIADTSETAPID
ncbi:uncharacterized protein BYT42DRAFT_611251 [Radiomyces spectabilis]|uniref:uncharacterized protein n=1 Tax=Radiomyces spectabilis TaxID=64574 RepID=UPI00221F0EA7|nr:uncharacterized protein BYT42DRAFT_611251 [Radiomyces spectabilis]KAI8388184.1 hypothetical protein BYT42DRAFT_611251 [Radiomyces spectabilis]